MQWGSETVVSVVFTEQRSSTNCRLNRHHMRPRRTKALRSSSLPSVVTYMVLFLVIAPLLCLSTLSAVEQKRQSNAAAAAQLFNSPLLTGAGSGKGGSIPPASASSSSLLSEMLTRSRTSSGAPIPRDICRPTGQISDAHCDYETVESVLNSRNFFETLDMLRQAPYFKYYKVDLYRDCPFWVENGLCMSKDCTVQKTDETEIPLEYRSAHLSSLSTASEEEVHGETTAGSKGPHFSRSTPFLSTAADASTCTCAETDFCHWEDEEWSPESQWVNLLENPERFTGYAGPSANKVWRAIYEENCFGMGTTTATSSLASPFQAFPSGPPSSLWLDPPREKGMGSDASGYVTSKDIFGSKESKGSASSEATLNQLLGSLASPLVDAASEQCLEKRVFYRLISGLHASISTHICHDHLDQHSGKWAPNLECFITRIAHHAERLENMYFGYLVLNRALAKLAERLLPSESQSSTIATIKSTMERALPLQLARGLPDSLMDESTPLLASLLVQASQSPPTFDERGMFLDDDNLRYEFRQRFRNVSRIMDCVGCDKCRLWGKLQVNGLGTALKILFGSGAKGEGAGTSNDGMLLQRSELVALINTIHRFGESLRAVEAFRTMYHDEVGRREQKEERDEEEKKTSVEKEEGETGNSESSLLETTSAEMLRTKTKTNGTQRGRNGESKDTDEDQAPTIWSHWISVCERKWGQCLRFLIDLFSPVSSSPSFQERRSGKQDL